MRRGRRDKRQRGSVMILFLLMLVGVILPAIGLGIDGGWLLLVQTKLSGAADAAALAGASSASSTAAKAYFAANFPNGWMGSTFASGQPVVSIGAASTTVAVSVNAPLYFMRIFGLDTAAVGAHAAAGLEQGGTCLYALDKTKAHAFYGNGTVQIGCGVAVESSSSDALHLDGGALGASRIVVNAIGGQTYPAGSVTPQPVKTPASRFSDPMATTVLPVFSGCTVSGIQTITKAATLTPGTYCGGIQISGGANVTFAPGLYVIAGGLKCSGVGTNVSGSGVTLFFTKGGNYSYGTVSIASGVVMNLSAPTSAAALSNGIPGMLMATDRNWKSTTSGISIDGSSGAGFEGVIYAPGVAVTFTGGSSNVSGKYFGVVADMIAVNSGASLTVPKPDYTGLKNGSPIQDAGLGPAYLLQ